jgi:glc operon protein GlcG
VDEGGNLVALSRVDQTFAAGAEISIGKARTAAMFRRPTSFFESVIREGRTPMVALEHFTPLQGGVPIEVDGQIVGAIGVSGASNAAEDEEYATIGARAVAASHGAEGPELAAASHFPREEVDRAFAAGATGSSLERAATYEVNPSRRDGPGEVEIHQHATDVIYVVSGSATLVTGGTASEPRTVSEGELRAASLEGGTEQALAAGDVVVIPRGTPHWFRAVQAPLTYFTVKVRG